MKQKRYVVLDTNCVLQSVSQRSHFYRIWNDFLDERYVLCVSNEILEEYEEIISRKMSPTVARLVVEMILRANNVLRVDAHYQFNLIDSDKDDNKFVDCAIAANADFIVSDDSHFRVLRQIPFPQVIVKSISKFHDELLTQA